MAHSLRLLALVILLGIGGCAPNGESPANPRPLELQATSGGFLGASYRVTLDPPRGVIYEFNPHTNNFTGKDTIRKVIPVHQEAWENFRTTLEGTNVQHWKRHHTGTVQDGHSWFFQVRYSDWSAGSDGRNAYPDKAHFEKLLAALRDLTGEDFR